MFAELQKTEAFITSVRSWATIPHVDVDGEMEPWYRTAYKALEASGFPGDACKTAIQLWNAEKKAVEYRQNYSEGWVPPSLEKFVDRPCDYVKSWRSGWLIPKKVWVEMQMQHGGETEYWRYPPSGGELPPPFDLPNGFTWDAESYQYWTIAQVVERWS